jgi:hypothetical protein
MQPITYVMSVRPYGRLSVWIKRGSHWTDYHEILYWRLLHNSVEKFKNRLKSGKNIRNLTWRSKWGLLLQAKLNRRESALVQRLIFLYCWQWHGAQQYIETALLHFHCHNGYANAPQCYTCIAYRVFLQQIRVALNILYVLPWQQPVHTNKRILSGKVTRNITKSTFSLKTN